jgi:hypothetical protein
MSEYELKDQDRELDLHLTDDQLRKRTEELLAVAGEVLPQLQSQTERLSKALDFYYHELHGTVGAAPKHRSAQ